MAWTAPMTAVTNDVWTSAQFNANVRDNLLETMPGKATTAGALFTATGANAIAQRSAAAAVVNTSQTRANAAYGDLTTVGPSVTVTTGTSALVWIQCEITNDTGPDVPSATTVKTYLCNGSASYQSDGDNRGVGECYQGFFDGTNGNQYSMIAFPYATIQADLADSTIDLVELWLDNQHTFSFSGGTAVIGTHNQTSVSGNHPSSQIDDDLKREHFDKGEAKWVTLPVSIGNAFRDNTTKGIGLGPGPNTSTTYYGFYAGNNQSGEPKLRITYTKDGTSGGYSKASFAVSGATTVAASDESAIYLSGVAANNFNRWGIMRKVTGLNPGSNTFTMNYAAGVSGATGTFARREIIVLPL